MTPDSVFKARVEAGAALLDERSPGWVDRFVAAGKKHGFDMQRTDVCVLGNSFRALMDVDEDLDGWDAGTRILGTDGMSSDFGFDAHKDDSGHFPHAYNRLAHFWQIAVLKRLPAPKRKAAKTIFN